MGIGIKAVKYPALHNCIRILSLTAKSAIKIIRLLYMLCTLDWANCDCTQNIYFEDNTCAIEKWVGTDTNLCQNGPNCQNTHI